MFTREKSDNEEMHFLDVLTENIDGQESSVLSQACVYGIVVSYPIIRFVTTINI